MVTHRPDGQVHSTPPPVRSLLLKAALSYAQRGVRVFPCQGKRPLTSHGFKDATVDASRLHAWWSRWPNANIGVPTGKINGFVVVDVDRLEALGELPAEIRTRTVRTPSGGLHLYLPYVEGVTNSSGSLPKGIDIRGEGGYVVAPPSAGYEVADRAPMIAEWPSWLLEMVRDASRRRDSGGHQQIDVPDGEPIREGVRNTALFFEALRLKDRGWSREQALQKLPAINDARCTPPLPTGEVERIVCSAFRYPARGSRTPPEVLAAVEELEKLWWETSWRGVGGGTERDVLRVLIALAKRYGAKVRDGVRVSISVRCLALAAACGYVTVSRVLKRLREKGILRGDNESRRGTEAGAWVLRTPRPTDNTQSIAGEACSSVITASRSTVADLRTPCFRWRGHVGKGRAGVLYALEAFGPQSVGELAERLGWARTRDLELRYLRPLRDMGLIEDRDGTWALATDHAERVEEIRRLPYSVSKRRVRSKTSEGRTVTRVEYSPAMSEIERERRDRERYERDRQRFREAIERRKVRAGPDAANSADELLEVPKNLAPPPDGEIRELVRFEPGGEGLEDHPLGCQCIACYRDQLAGEEAA